MQCPFKIAYSHQGIKEKVKKLGIFTMPKSPSLLLVDMCIALTEDWSFGG
jgi:hypothetical protein